MWDISLSKSDLGKLGFMSNSFAEDYYVVIFVRLDPLSIKWLRRWLIRWVMKYVCVCLFLFYNQIVPLEHAFFTILNMVLCFLFLQVRIVRVTKRVHEAYVAQLYLTKAYKLYPCTLVLFFIFLGVFFGGGGWNVWKCTTIHCCDGLDCSMSWQVGNETECVSFDLRPSDAINIAVRCKVLCVFLFMNLFYMVFSFMELTIILEGISIA